MGGVPDGPKREAEMSRLRRRAVPDRQRNSPAGAPRQGGDSAEWMHAGEHVMAALEVAKQAAEDTLDSARREADRFLAEVEKAATATVTAAARKAQAVRREGERLRAEAERYSTETRKAADTYASEKRRVADEAAAKATREAEERVRRQAAIVAEAARFEDRLQNLVTVFRGMTDQLEDLLAKGHERVEGEVPAGETLQETLEKPVTGPRARLPS
jgi:chromosome segregation ATPase